MSIRNVFPTVRPSLNLNFARSKTLDPRITFSRTTTATYLDSDGLLKTAAADEPRFDHKYENGNIVSLGLLIEGGETNSVRKSEDLTIGRWTEVGDGVTVTTNQAVAPDGNTTADKVAIKTTGSGVKAIQSSILSGSISGSGTAITSSIFCKAAEHNYVSVEMQGGGNSGSIVVDLSDGSLITEVSSPDSYKIEPYPNDWYRISVTSTTANTSATALRVHLTDSSGNSTWTGTIGNGVYLWGGQHEVGAFPTSYIPTDDTSGGKTREPDNVSVTGTDFSDFYNQSEGTLYASASILGKNIHTTGTEYPNGICKISDTGSNLAYSRVLYFGGQADPDRVTFGNRDASAGSISPRDDTFGDIQLNQYYKVCGAYITNDEQAMCLNGRDIKFNGTNVNPPTPNQFLIGTGYHGAIGNAPGGDEMYLNGHISELRYYPKRLSNDQLQNLTK